MQAFVTYLLTFCAAATTVVHACPDSFVPPPPGSDIGLCPNICRNNCYYAPETNGVCSNDPSSYNSEVDVFEVLSSQFCTIYSEENCQGETIAQLQGPSYVIFDATYVKSVQCVA